MVYFGRSSLEKQTGSLLYSESVQWTDAYIDLAEVEVFGLKSCVEPEISEEFIQMATYLG